MVDQYRETGVRRPLRGTHPLISTTHLWSHRHGRRERVPCGIYRRHGNRKQRNRPQEEHHTVSRGLCLADADHPFPRTRHICFPVRDPAGTRPGHHHIIGPDLYCPPSCCAPLAPPVEDEEERKAHDLLGGSPGRSTHRACHVPISCRSTRRLMCSSTSSSSW